MKEVKWIMFDADNTLLDFSKASKDALWSAFSDYGHECNEEIYGIYKEINTEIWNAFEAGTISAIDLRPLRFARLFEAIGQEIAPASDFSVAYLQNLVVCSEMYQGVDRLLDNLRTNYKLSLITNGLKEVQRPRLARLKLDHYFDSIVVSDEIGVAKPDAGFFDYTFQTFKHEFNKNEVLVVGDNIVADVDGANKFGFKSCWINQGKENTSAIKPDYSLSAVNELMELINKHTNESGD